MRRTTWCCWKFNVHTRRWTYFGCSQKQAKIMAADLRARGHCAYAAHEQDIAPFMAPARKEEPRA